MALTRKMLKGMNLTDEQIDTIIEGHDETVTALKTERDDWKAKAGAAETLKTERDDLKQQLDAQKGGTDWKAEYDKLKASVDAKETASKIREAYREVLKAEHIDETLHDLILDATDMTGKKLDKDGRLENAEAIAANVREKYAAHVVKTEQKATPTKTPPASQPKAMTREEIWAKDDKGRYKLTTEQRQQALVEHPELMQPGTA